jgi:methylmalonyl-CoA epimerase
MVGKDALRLHHVGYVVSDIDAAADAYKAMGFDEGERHDIPEQKIVAMTFHAGPGWMELIQPTDPEGPIAAFMAKRGEGVHHVAFQVEDIQLRGPVRTAGASRSFILKHAMGCSRNWCRFLNDRSRPAARILR